METIDFKTSAYFSGSVIFVGIILLAVGLPVMFMNIFGGLILCLISIVIFTTHYRLRINFDKGEYQDYLWILGFRNGEKEKFTSIEYLFIKKSNLTQTMQLRVASTTIQKEVFDEYLKFSTENRIHLLTKDNKNKLIKDLKRISVLLNVKIIDYSDGSPKEI